MKHGINIDRVFHALGDLTRLVVVPGFADRRSMWERNAEK